MAYGCLGPVGTGAAYQLYREQVSAGNEDHKYAVLVDRHNALSSLPVRRFEKRFTTAINSCRRATVGRLFSANVNVYTPQRWLLPMAVWEFLYRTKGRAKYGVCPRISEHRPLTKIVQQNTTHKDARFICPVLLRTTEGLIL